ncbi:alpha-L-rhamnosidase [Tamlana crocina]|uniref:alpha-L-rhamnosidase n=1 Tax=Tamlana crocina TaxID=393006 RepID=A0ABX1D7F3_9FLAO|nr:alpha-L-rhamnosidase [Tamlana crocina]NJX14290.1 family 78 glycoside hydrolase catalytic domain [Tamlana crocina]
MKKFRFLFAAYFVLSFFLYSCHEQTVGAPVSLTLSEGFKNPVGFYNAKPTFSWQLPISDDVKSQLAYQIVVASSKELLPNHPDLWDSKKQESSQSTFVNYEGAHLKSRQKVYWQVKFWNQEGTASQWSEINTFELGLLNNTDWKAKWTGLDTAKDSIKGVHNFLMHIPQYLRKRFKLNSEVESARLYITAKGVFDVHINGKDVSEDVMPPGWTPYNHRIETLTYNVTDVLQSNQNVLAVELASGWHSGRISRGTALYENFASPKILCQLEITLEDGSKQTIISDDTWKGTTNGPIRLAGIYDGETYDANLEMPNWTNPEFDDSSWQPVEVEAIDDGVKLEPKRHYTVKTKTVLDDVKLVSVEGNAAIFNIQQNIVGVPKVKVPMKKGDTLKIRFSEMLLKDGTFYTKNYRSAHSTDYYIASKDGLIEYMPKFTFHGFQFVELSGFDENATPEPNWVQGLAQHSNFEQKGSFTSSHDKLNQLQSNITWGLRDNFFDIPTDCPQRDERLGWTGDAQVIAPTALFNYGTHAFWTAWLQSLRENQSEHENGAVPFIVPDVLQNKNASPGWGDACTIIPWDVYNITGDTTILEESYESAKKWVDFYKSKVKNIPYVPSMFAFGDWLQPFPKKDGKMGNRGDTPNELISTAYFAHSVNLVSKIAGVLGHNEDEKKYKSLYENIAHAFDKTFFDENGKYSGKVQTQTSYLLAIYFDLLPSEKKKKAQQFLLKEIEKADNHLRTGFLGTPILPKVLDAMGEIDLMYNILFKETYPSWFYSINQGATTMWERWNSYSIQDGYNTQPMNSLNHYAYGAIGQWMYERIAGIAALEPGYKKIRIAPVPNINFLNAASASVNTPYGKASSSWKIEHDSFYLDIIIPPNTTALVSIPTTNSNDVDINGEKISKNEIKNQKEDLLIIEVSAGKYNINSNFKSKK